MLFITKAKKIQRFLFSKLFIEIFVLKFYIMITRLKQFIVYKGFTVASFERSASLANGCIGMAEKRNGGLNYDALQKVLNSFPELNANWLLTGRGSMLNDSAKVPETQREITVSIKIDVSDPLYNELIQRLKK